MKEKLLPFFALLLANWALVVGIKLENVTIPQYAIKDSQVTLSCFFDLQSEKLLAVKWFKEDNEFFRYSIHSAQTFSIFPLEGVFVEITQSNMNQVVLKNISLKTSGVYRCEITADPSFQAVSQQGDLIVVSPPRALPKIDCHPQVVQQGDKLSCNCTSHASKPAASLMFYLNDGKANFGDMIEYLPILEPHGLETGQLGLVFTVEAAHLKNGKIILKCTATIGNSYYISNVTLQEAGIKVNAQPSSPGLGHLSGGFRGNGSRGLLLTFFTLLALLNHQFQSPSFLH